MRAHAHTLTYIYIYIKDLYICLFFFIIIYLYTHIYYVIIYAHILARWRYLRELNVTVRDGLTSSRAPQVLKRLYRFPLDLMEAGSQVFPLTSLESYGFYKVSENTCKYFYNMELYIMVYFISHLNYSRLVKYDNFFHPEQKEYFWVMGSWHENPLEIINPTD